MQDTVQYNNSVMGFQTALARQEGLCSRLPILTFQCQKICVCFWCGAAKRRHFFAVITVSEPVHEAVRKCLTDRLRDLLEFQQITIQMDALFIVQRKAFQDGRQRNGKFPGQKSIEKIRSLASGDDVCPRTGVFA